jgi:hypothetical protein
MKRLRQWEMRHRGHDTWQGWLIGWSDVAYNTLPTRVRLWLGKRGL